MPPDDTSITSVRARPLDIPMRKPFGIAGGAQAVAANVLVEVELGAGARGYGEAAPFPAFNGETQAAALAAARRAGDLLVGRDARRWRALAELVQSEATCEGRRVASAACALETALLDALTRALGTSLHAWFGGAGTALETDVTITTGTEEDAVAEARAFAAFTTLKIKVGGGPVDADLARVRAVAAARPDATLLLDANGGFTPDGAIRLARELGRAGVVPALFEQPVSPSSAGGEEAALEALAALRAETGLPVALDELITHPADVVRAHRAGAADAINLKLMKSGIARGLEVVAATRACGLQPMIGGMVEARLAIGASACLAAGLGGFAFVDLDTPLFLAADPFEGGYAQAGASLDVSPIALGHGCRPGRGASPG